MNALAEGQTAGLRFYAGSCGNGGRLLVPPAVDNRDALRQAIEGLVAGGGTPTPDALRAAARDFPEGSTNKLVILISDGMSTCGDPCPVAAQLAADTGTAFRAHTVGFHAPSSAEWELACVADVTGGRYYSAADADGLAEAISDALAGTGHEYVAIGDSTTTGFSIPDCEEDRIVSPFGCVGAPTATPYPERIAAAGNPRFDELERKGIWGDTIVRSVESYDRGNNGDGSTWVPQLVAADQADRLVTVSHGASDMKWSAVEEWAEACIGARHQRILGRDIPRGIEFKEDVCKARADEVLAEFGDDMRRMFDVLEGPQLNGSDVVIALYYNPVNHEKVIVRRFLPDSRRDCSLMHNLAQVVVNRLNAALAAEAQARGFQTVDLRPVFAGHGSGAKEPYVFGVDCEWRGVPTAIRLDIDLRARSVEVDGDQTLRELGQRFDPHPNSAGTRAQAEAILEVLQ
ncbi:MAG TPA: VWA domain-containing protein [Egibacteraceae bacterium]|nr:VWA domain-containing protein [Egibacteraceae bacterium]